MNTELPVEIDDGLDDVVNKGERKRMYYTVEQKMEMMKHIRRYLVTGMTYREMKADLEKKGFRLAQGSLFNIILEMKEEMASWQDGWRVVVERIEKQKYLEREALALYNQIKEDRHSTLQERMLAMRLLSQIQNETHEFISRFNLLPAIPVRSDGASTAGKIPVDQLVCALIEEKEEFAKQTEERNKKELSDGTAKI